MTYYYENLTKLIPIICICTVSLEQTHIKYAKMNGTIEWFIISRVFNKILREWPNLDLKRLFSI